MTFGWQRAPCRIIDIGAEGRSGGGQSEGSQTGLRCTSSQGCAADAGQGEAAIGVYSPHATVVIGPAVWRYVHIWYPEGCLAAQRHDRSKVPKPRLRDKRLVASRQVASGARSCVPALRAEDGIVIIGCLIRRATGPSPLRTSAWNFLCLVRLQSVLSPASASYKPTAALAETDTRSHYSTLCSCVLYSR